MIKRVRSKLKKQNRTINYSNVSDAIRSINKELDERVAREMER